MSTNVSPPLAKPIRLTIAVTPEVHAAFERLAAASGMSMSKCMGEWLGDTLDAVEYTAGLVERARAAPKMVMREVHAYAQGLADETGSLLSKIVTEGQRSAAERRSRDPATVALASIPPRSNTGGKPTPNTAKKQARK